MKFEAIEKRLEEISVRLDEKNIKFQDIMQQERMLKNLLISLPVDNYKEIFDITTEQKQNLQESLVNLNNKLLKIKEDNLFQKFKDNVMQQNKQLSDLEERYKTMSYIESEHDAGMTEIDMKEVRDNYLHTVKDLREKYSNLKNNIQEEREELNRLISKIITPISNSRDMLKMRKTTTTEPTASIGIHGLRSRAGILPGDIQKAKEENRIIEEARLKELFKKKSLLDMPDRNSKAHLGPLTTRKKRSTR